MYSVNKLIIIGGLSRSGKTTLLNQLSSGKLNPLYKTLNLENISNYEFCNDIDLGRLNQNIDKLIVHYDFLARYSLSQKYFEFLQNLLNSSNEITVLTVCATADALIKRNDLTIYKLLQKLCKTKNSHPYSQHLPLVNNLRNRMNTQRVYNDNENIPYLYEKWFDIFKQYSNCNHWLVDSQKPNQPIPCPENMDDIWAFINSTAP